MLRPFPAAGRGQGVSGIHLDGVSAVVVMPLVSRCRLTVCSSHRRDPAPAALPRASAERRHRFRRRWADASEQWRVPAKRDEVQRCPNGRCSISACCMSAPCELEHVRHGRAARGRPGWCAAAAGGWTPGREPESVPGQSPASSRCTRPWKAHWHRYAIQLLAGQSAAGYGDRCATWIWFGPSSTCRLKFVAAGPHRRRNQAARQPPRSWTHRSQRGGRPLVCRVEDGAVST